LICGLQNQKASRKMGDNDKQTTITNCQSRFLYLDLMKRCLTNWIYGEAEAKLFSEQRTVEIRDLPLAGLTVIEQKVFQGIEREVQSMTAFDEQLRAEGRDWPPTAHTMIGLRRLDNLQACIEDLLARNVPGDLIETGSWRGGATIFMRAVLKAYGVEDRVVWVADSFEGLPAPDPRRYPSDFGSVLHLFAELSVTLDQVKRNFERYGLLDDQVRFLKGWFKDTLPTAPVERLALARLDGDMYESTRDGLESLYPKLSIGGYLIIDDYGEIPPCRQAVADYRRAHGITEKILPIDSSGVYWQRER
jgi:O-methyltransferase